MEKTKTIRRLVLEQFGYIDVEIELDLSLEPDQMYEFATKTERNLDAYKSAFWDLMKEKKATRLEKEASKAQEKEKETIQDAKAAVAKLIADEPDVVKAKVDEFNGLIDESAAAALILKDRSTPAEAPVQTGVRSPAPTFPDTMTFYPGKKGGWACYTDIAVIDGLVSWLVSIPDAERGRKTAQPKKSNNGKCFYCNDKEKAIVDAEASKQGKKTFTKEA